MDPVTAAVAAALEPAAASIYVGFSGGRDSTVLLHAAAGIALQRLVAVHVHHGLHPAADDWQRRCEAFAAELGVRLLVRRVTVTPRGSVEARARAARYRVFAELLERPDSLLLLAHHRNDQSETVLLRLLQGRGVYGMPHQRRLAAGRLLRPLLDLAPAELAAYAVHHGLSWLDDPANLDLRLDRNFLRHRVLPLLRQHWPDTDARLLAAMAATRAADQRLTAILGRAADAHALPVAVLRDRPEPECLALLRVWLQRRGQPTPSRRALRELLRQALTAAPDQLPRLELDGAAVAVYRGELHILPAPAPVQAGGPLRLPGTLRLPHGELVAEADSVGFQAVGAVEVRYRVGGERLVVDGHHRTLKQLLQEAGVPPWQRDRLPLLFDARGLLAVPGVAHRDRTSADAGWRVLWRPWPQAPDPRAIGNA